MTEHSEDFVTETLRIRPSEIQIDDDLEIARDQWDRVTAVGVGPHSTQVWLDGLWYPVRVDALDEVTVRRDFFGGSEVTDGVR